jgi:phospholipid/cholesterol/gamma-HCH transport system substrate-binding protein
MFTALKNATTHLQLITDSAFALVSNVKNVMENKQSPVGIMLYDEQAGYDLKQTMQNLNSGSKKLDDNLEALQHNILLRGYFRKKAKYPVDTLNTGN